MTRLRSVSVAVGLTVALAAAGCGNGPPNGGGGGGGASATPVGTAPATGTPKVTVQATSNLTFDPTGTSLKVGDIVLFKNTSQGIPHDVTFDAPAAALTSLTLQYNDTWAVQFSVAGSYAYHCSFHSGMDGTITVAP